MLRVHHSHFSFITITITITIAIAIISFSFSFLLHGLEAATDPTDVSVLKDLLAHLSSDPSNLSQQWSGTDPCGDGAGAGAGDGDGDGDGGGGGGTEEVPPWPYIQCTGNHVTQLQLKGLGLTGTLPPSLNSLSSLQHIALQGNSFHGPLPTFSGLSSLISAYLGDQHFTSIPADFFHGLTSLTTLSLENNPLSGPGPGSGWNFPEHDIASLGSLTTLILTNTSLTGPIPGSLGSLTSLVELRLAYNSLSGPIPGSFRSLSRLSRLELNNQAGSPLYGPIDAVASMPSLKTLWLHVNAFSGRIPPGLGTSAISLSDCRLNDNRLVGPIPASFSKLSSLQHLSLQNNLLVGSIPSLPSLSSFTYSGNNFCSALPGAPCAPETSALLSFLDSVNYPSSLLSSWDGDNPCASASGASSSWLGVTCDPLGKNVVSLNLPNSMLNGTISPSLANLTHLAKIVLRGNYLYGTIPSTLTHLTSLVLLDLSNNNLDGPLPSFNTSRVNLILTGNANINNNNNLMPSSSSSSSLPFSTSSSGLDSADHRNTSSKFPPAAIVGIVLGVIGLLVLVAASVFCFLMYKRKRAGSRVQSPTPAHARAAFTDPEANGDMYKVTVTMPNTPPTLNNNEVPSENNVQVIEAGNLVVSIQLLRNVTNDFGEENMVGRGGFGVVYKGELDDGTKIAVKRMTTSCVSENNGLNEFQAEIGVLTKVRHRNLVALLGYCVCGNERLLVYEYMPKGTLSQHLFEWKKLGLSPLPWDKRLGIALDMARGIEYLHGLAHKSFIHRDLKPSNVLLGDDYRAKVSDFGLVKLAPEGTSCLETRLAGTFGYLAPEYAVTGRVTTKSDVFSFGVILMELLTGHKALDETKPEESMHLVTWFRRVIHGTDKGELFDHLDPALNADDAIAVGTTSPSSSPPSSPSQSVLMVAELAWHCTAREPQNRPDMSHAVNVLSPIVEQWKPNDVPEDEEGIDLDLTLPQALKKWQAYEGTSVSSSDNTRDSMVSMPACPSGLVHSFTSMDGR